MFVGSNGQFVAPLKAAALENSSPIGGGHARAEAVHTHAAADLGLISSLGHSSFFLIPSKDDYTIPDGTVFLSWTARYFTPRGAIRSI